MTCRHKPFVVEVYKIAQINWLQIIAKLDLHKLPLLIKYKAEFLKRFFQFLVADVLFGSFYQMDVKRVLLLQCQRKVEYFQVLLSNSSNIF